MLVIQSTKKIAQNINELKHNNAIAPPAVIHPPLTMLQIISKTNGCKNSADNAPGHASLHERAYCKKGIKARAEQTKHWVAK
jgi:hypothetical protein